MKTLQLLNDFINGLRSEFQNSHFPQGTRFESSIVKGVFFNEDHFLSSFDDALISSKPGMKFAITISPEGSDALKKCYSKEEKDGAMLYKELDEADNAK